MNFLLYSKGSKSLRLKLHCQVKFYKVGKIVQVVGMYKSIWTFWAVFQIDNYFETSKLLGQGERYTNIYKLIYLQVLWRCLETIAEQVAMVPATSQCKDCDITRRIY